MQLHNDGVTWTQTLMVTVTLFIPGVKRLKQIELKMSPNSHNMLRGHGLLELFQNKNNNISLLYSAKYDVSKRF